MPVAEAKAKTATTTAKFPATEVERRIREFLAEEGAMQATLHGAAVSPIGTAAAVGPQPVIDSLVVVSLLVELEPMVGFELPEDLVRAGGYDSIEQVVQHLLPQVQKRWNKKHEEKK
jgi:acyl carrier protein